MPDCKSGVLCGGIANPAKPRIKGFRGWVFGAVKIQVPNPKNQIPSSKIQTQNRTSSLVIFTFPHPPILSLANSQLSNSQFSNCKIVTLSNCQILTSSHCQIAKLSNCYILKFSILKFSNSQFSNCHIVKLPNCPIVTLPNCPIVTFSNSQIPTSQPPSPYLFLFSK